MEHESTTVLIDGARVRKIREEQKLTQLYVATAVEVTTDTVSRWENRRYPSIKRENALKLAEALNVSLQDLMEQEEQAALTGKEATAPVEEDSLWRKKIAGRKGLLLAGVCIAALGLLLVLLLPGRKAPGVQAVRYLPGRVLPGRPFPVLIRLKTDPGFSSSFLLRETIPAGCTMDQTVPPALAHDTIGRQVKWIRNAGDRTAMTFTYLLTPAKDMPMGTTLHFAGTVVIGRRGALEPEILGARETRIGPFHWADENRDHRIDDYEMLSVYELFPHHKELGIDIAEIEAIWADIGYRWNPEPGTIELLPARKSTSPYPTTKVNVQEGNH